MIDDIPEVGSDRPPLASDSAQRPLVALVWSIWSALGLVTFAFVLTLLAGTLVAEIIDAGWGKLLHALLVGGVFVGMYAAMVGIVWAVSASSGVRFAEAVGARKPVGARWYATAVVVAAGGWLFSVTFMTALQALGIDVPREDLAVYRLMPSGLLGAAIMSALLIVVAPLAEEVVYRGVLLSAIDDRWGSTAALVFSAVVFSAAHLSLVGFLPLFVVGALFGWLFLTSRSLKVAIVAHAVFNSLGVAVLLAQKTSGIL